MKKEAAKKGYDLLEEIDNLRRYGELLGDEKDGHLLHFEIIQGYHSSCRKIIIKKEHTIRLLAQVEKIIEELESELETL